LLHFSFLSFFQSGFLYSVFLFSFFPSFHILVYPVLYLLHVSFIHFYSFIPSILHSPSFCNV
jgi:hypothetical protein